MSKLRLLFVKEQQASYISHLDLMRTFQRIFPRTGMELSHSNGFHPHPLLSIVLPLPVGQESECELLDFEVGQQTDGAGIAEALNTGLPMGLRVLACYPLVRPMRDLAYLRASVVLFYDNGVPEGAADRLTALLQRPSLPIEKKTKHKALATVDIAPMLREVALHEENGSIQALVTVSAQNPGLNPAYLAQVIERELPDCRPDFVRVRRKELFDENMEIFR